LKICFASPQTLSSTNFRETFVGDFSIFQQNTEFKFPNALAKINSTGVFSLSVPSGTATAWIGYRSNSPLIQTRRDLPINGIY
jgi:hypothetical protein